MDVKLEVSPNDQQQDPARNPLEELSKEYSLLLKQRALAIERCEFKKAKQIDCHTDRLREQIEITKAKTENIQNNLQFDYKKEAVMCKATKSFKETNDTIFNLKAEFQERMITLHQTHTDQLTRLANEYSSELELETSRLNPDSRHLLKQAKFNAKNRNYSTAEQLYNESNQTRNDMSDKRQNDVHVKYEIAKAQIEKKFQREIRICKEKEMAEITLSVENFKKYMNQMKRYMEKTATDLGIHATPEDYAFLDEFNVDIGIYDTPNISPKAKTPSRSSSRASNAITPRSGKRNKTTPKQPLNTSPRTLETRFGGSIRSSRLSTPRK